MKKPKKKKWETPKLKVLNLDEMTVEQIEFIKAYSIEDKYISDKQEAQ